MYLLAVTREPLTDEDGRFGDHPVHRARFGTLFVTAVTDGKFARFVDQPDECRITDMLTPIAEASSELVRSTVVLSRDSKTITMSMTPEAVGNGYYVIDDNGDLFCSTRVSFLRDAGVPIVENREVLTELFTYGYVAPPNTMFRKVKRLWLGCRISFEVRRGAFTVASRTIPRPVPAEKREESVSPEQAADRAIEALAEQVRALNPYKDRVAVPLSGGLDSSILWALCHRELGVRHSYSTSYPFEDPRRDIERDYAVSAAKAFGAEHRHFETTDDEFLGAVIGATCAAEEPIHMAAAMFYLQYATGVPPATQLLVSGGGADSYQGKRFFQKIHVARKDPWTRWAMARPALARRLAGWLRSAGLRTKKLDLANGITCPADDPAHVAWMVDKGGSERWAREIFGVVPEPSIQGRSDLIKLLEGYGPMDLAALVGMFSTVSVSQGIWATLAESRGLGMTFPFLSETVMDTAFSVSWPQKLEPPKNILHQVARRLNIPEFIITRKKTGLGSAPALWAVEGGVLEPLLVLCDGIFDLKMIRRLQRKPNSRNSTIFWCILNYSIWKRLFVDVEPVGALLERIDAASGRVAGRN